MDKSLEPRIDGIIDADEIIVGKGVRVDEGVLITGKAGPARRVVLGDFCYIGRQTRIMVPSFCLGDYSKLHAFSFAHGDRPLQIGRNCWIGGNTVLDSLGGLDIEDNVGIGAHSQVWTHIQFGDIVEGSRFHSRKYMSLGKDSWFVGHCIVSPVHVGAKSMAMIGSVVTRDMLPNHVYAGVPATDVSDKLGYQFETRTIEQKQAKLQELVDIFVAEQPEFAGQIIVVGNPRDRRDDICWFDVSDRSYNKRFHPAEMAFLKKNVPIVKFTPAGEGPFFEPQKEAI